MSYYHELNMEKEPFSISPDPEFLYRSDSHAAALKRLEIAIRLKRGMSLIIGDVGIGKTTILRALAQEFSEEKDFMFHLILDPGYRSEFQFLAAMSQMFNITPDYRATHAYKKEIEKYLLRMGVEENKTIVLLIDEGQKLTNNFLEVLRMLLNYETNEFKLLQLVIMGQTELLPRIKKISNFHDRISLKYIINPMDEYETEQMINFRLERAGLPEGKPLFTQESMKLIYEFTSGYPRKISLLCHNALEELIIEDKQIVDKELIVKIIKRGDV